MPHTEVLLSVGDIGAISRCAAPLIIHLHRIVPAGCNLIIVFEALGYIALNGSLSVVLV